MKTPFTPYFKRANVSLTQVSHEPFEPCYPMPFIDADCTEYWVGEHCQFIYRWHDGFDVFVATLEARLCSLAGQDIDLPVESFLHDLHLIYQLAGESRLPRLALPSQHHTQVYAVPSKGTLRIRTEPGDQRYILCVAVPKSKWVTRLPDDSTNPWGQLMESLRKRHADHRLLQPTAISSSVQLWLYVLLTTPRRIGMSMDHALNHAIVNLIDVHLAEARKRKRMDAEHTLVASARSLIIELLTRMNNGDLPTAAFVAEVLHTTPQHLRSAHYGIHGQKFQHYIIKARIEEAKHRLCQGTPISAIAFALGWTDAPHFVTQFKKHTGFTPGEYIKKCP